MKRLFLFLFACVAVVGQITNVNIGTSANDKSGDTLRTAFSKVNTNVAWLAGQLGAATNSPNFATNATVAGADVATKVANVAALVALSPKQDGQLVQTLGYYSAGDGGGAVYRYSASSSESTNFGAVIKPSAVSGRFINANPTEVTARQFGAKPANGWKSIGYATSGASNAPIGISDFSVAVETQFPSSSDVSGLPAGLQLGLFRISTADSTQRLNGGWSYGNSSIECYLYSAGLQILFRTTNGSSSTAAGAGTYLIPTASLGSLWSQSGSFVVTRSGTNIAAYINGSALPSGTYVNQSRFGEAVSGSTGSRLDVGVSNTEAFNAWRKNITRARVFLRVLSGADLSNPWSAASPLDSFSGYWAGEDPEDSSSRIQSAIDWANTQKGSVLIDGRFRVDSPIYIKPSVSVIGIESASNDSVSPMVINGTQTSFGPSSLFKWFGSTNDMVVIDGSLYPAALYDYNASNLGETYNIARYSSSVKSLTLDFATGYIGAAVTCNYVSGILLDELTLLNWTGSGIKSYACSVNNFRSIKGVGSSYFAISSDSDVSNWSISGYGSVVALVSCAAFNVHDNLIFNASSFARKNITASSVSTTTGIITVGQNFYSTGDFVMVSGALPTGLDNRTAYFAYRISSTEIGLATNLANARSGVIVVPSTATSGFTISPGPTRNLYYLGGSALMANNNRVEEGYEHDVEIDNVGRGMISDTMAYRSGFLNPTNAWAGIYIRNSVGVGIANTFAGTRTASSEAIGIYGVLIGTNNTQVFQRGVYGQVTYPVAVSPDQSRAVISPDYEQNAQSIYGQYPKTVGALIARSEGQFSLMSDVVSDTAPPSLRGFRARGTRSNPSPVLADDTLLELRADGLFGVSGITTNVPYEQSGIYTSTNTAYSKIGIRLRAGENWSSTAQGTYIDFYGTTYGTTNLYTMMVMGPWGSIQYNPANFWGNIRVGNSSSGSVISRIRRGRVSLVAGSATVSDSNVTASSDIQLTSNADGGTPGWVRVSARSVGTSFTITSSSGTDTSSVAWLMIEP